MKKIYIYVLYDPDNSEHIRYVGKTTSVKRRFNSHIKEAYSLEEKNYSHKQNWIRSLLDRNILPEMKIIETINDDNIIWQDREKYWIKYYKDLGHDLTNSTKGGDGGSGGPKFKGHKHKASSIELIKENNKLFWNKEENRKLRSDSTSGDKNPMYGKIHTAETRKIISDKAKLRVGKLHPRYGTKHTEESKNKMRGKRVINIENHNTAKKVKMIDENGEIIKIWDAKKYCYTELNLKAHELTKIINRKIKFNNYYFEIIDEK